LFACTKRDQDDGNSFLLFGQDMKPGLVAITSADERMILFETCWLDLLFNLCSQQDLSWQLDKHSLNCKYDAV
jgi:hypothetical protein